MTSTPVRSAPVQPSPVPDRQSVPPVDVRVSISPQSSVFGMARALCGETEGVPVDLRRKVLHHIDPRATATALRPFQRSTSGWLPDCVAPWWVGDLSVDQFGEWLRGAGADSLQRDVQSAFGGDRDIWGPQADRPARWLDAYSRMSRSIWSTLEPLWRHRAARLDAEVHRIGVAQVRGTTDALLHTLHPRIGYQDGEIVLGDPHPCRVPLAGRTLNLVPMIAGGPQILVHADDPDVLTVAYALPGALGAARGAVQVSDVGLHDGLSLVLGSARAGILRLLHTTRTMGALAQRSALAPSTVSHHCDLLENAGLILRQRAGQAVRATLTPRGAAVVDLLS